MWNFVVMLVLLSLTGFYAMADKSGPAVIQTPKTMPYAENMAVYREAVITWFTAHPADTGSIGIDTLIADGAVPAWSSLRQSPASTIWKNFRDANGVIYVYASPLPPVNIVPDMVELAQNSQYAGVFRTGDTTLFSPVAGDTGIPLPAGKFTNGSPVWVAMTR